MQWLKSLFSLSGFSSKLWLCIVAILVGVCASMFVVLKQFDKRVKELEAQKSEIQESLIITEVTLQRQSDSIKRANADLQTYKKKLEAQSIAILAKYKNLQSDIKTCEEGMAYLHSIVNTFTAERGSDGKQGD